MAELRQVKLDGKVQWKLICPNCGGEAFLDDDQFHGRVSTQCPFVGCTFHKTVDWSKEVQQ